MPTNEEAADLLQHSKAEMAEVLIKREADSLGQTDVGRHTRHRVAVGKAQRTSTKQRQRFFTNGVIHQEQDRGHGHALH